MGARLSPALHVPTGQLDFDFIPVPRDWDRNKRRLTFGPFGRTILEEIWAQTQGRLRPRGAPAPEYACLTYENFAEAEIAGRYETGTTDYKRELKGLLSTAHTAIADMVKRKVITRLTSTQATKLGLVSSNSKSRWYKCNWQVWSSLPTPSASPYVKPAAAGNEKPDTPQPKVVAIRPEQWRTAKAGTPVNWKFTEPKAVQSVEVVFPEANGKVAMDESGGKIVVSVIQVTENTQIRPPVHRRSDDTVSAAGLSSVSAAAACGASQAAAGKSLAEPALAKSILSIMAELRSPITAKEAAQIAARLAKSSAGIPDSDWLRTTVHKRAARETRARRDFNFVILGLYATDIAEDLWPQESQKRAVEREAAERSRQIHESLLADRDSELRAQLADPALAAEDRELIMAALGESL